MHEMRIMSPIDGDKHVTWDPNDPKSVKKARKAFEKHVDAGHKAFKVKHVPDRKGSPVKTFNPDEEEYLLAPAMAGG